MTYTQSGDPLRGLGSSNARGKNLDHLRRTNLSLALGMIHEAGSLSRADLTKALGLNRSTIAALVGELSDRGLVVENQPGTHNQVGRPSLVISPSPDVVAISVKPDVDALTIALVGLGGTVIRRVRYDNSGLPSASEVLTIVRAVVEGMTISATRDHRIFGVGLAIPGLVRASDGLVRLAPHLEWRDEPLARRLSETTGFEVSAANDAMCGAVAEFTFGAGRGSDDMVFLHGGASGIGGGIVVDGVPLSGANGYAGELGHTLVNSAGVECHCGATGCLETEVRRAPLLAAVGLDDSTSDRLEQRLLEAMADGDREVRELVVAQAESLLIALRNIVNTFNTRRVVLGGFLAALLAAAPEVFRPIMETGTMEGSPGGIELVGAMLGRNAALIGAAELVFRPLLSDPTIVGSAERRGSVVAELARLNRSHDASLAV